MHNVFGSFAKQNALVEIWMLVLAEAFVDCYMKLYVLGSVLAGLQL